MVKKPIENEKKKGLEKAAISEIRKTLGPNCACYVLICCSEPSEKGNMEVELHFEGDESLAGLLVENANQIFNERASLRDTP